MLFLYAASLTAFFYFSVSFRAVLTPLIQPLHEACLRMWVNPLWAQLGGALVCGADLPAESSLRGVFIQTGLYHILVVSGAHLVFLCEGLRWLTRDRVSAIWIAIPLLLFAVMTQFQAPVVRAGAEMILLPLMPTKRPRKERVILSVLLTLCVDPPWIQSFSLLLSFAAALALTLGQTADRKTLWMIALTLPILLPFGTFNPLAPLAGILLGPAIEIFLFPVALLVWLWPLAQIKSEHILSALVQLLTEISSIFPHPWPAPWRLSSDFLWVIFAALSILTPSPIPSLKRRPENDQKGLP